MEGKGGRVFSNNYKGQMEKTKAGVMEAWEGSNVEKGRKVIRECI